MSAELAGQSARAFLPFLPNSDLEGDNKRGCFEDQSRVPECLLASSFMELIEFFESAQKQPGPVHAHAQGLDERMQVWIPDQLEATMWRLKQIRCKEDIHRTSSRLFDVTENHNKWLPVYTTADISDLRSSDA
ncbi:hypothetical protein Q7C36_019194 [Tachysurus vachellii]|uniref:Uncharacterized protein n=1 Tax=Tachysurus vachellii TaxID=175792 RepID=A0AA88LWL7_TACVA|nr:hypothetical protein Q7C36_019194 [Tachysurus vachellii]